MTTTTFDVSTLSDAVEADDVTAQADLYHPDVVVEVHNRDHGPSEPQVLRGRDAVRAALDDVASRGLTHSVDRAVSDGRSGALQVTCRYPDGQKVVCALTFDLEESLIVRETRFEVWD
jgi:ketosteroid isomerase-like protein